MSVQADKINHGDPELSFVILEYLSVEEIKIATDSIKESGLSQAYEIIVPSNSCYKSSKKKELMELLPDVKWIFNPVNGGFAYGMNRGLELARGKYLIIMNSDVRLLSGIQGMIAYAESRENIGAIGPQTINNKGEIQDSFRSFVTPFSLAWRNLLRIFAGIHGPGRKGLSSEIHVTDWLAGSFIMVSRTAYSQVGALDERYFLYAEDMDWCYRFKQAGFEVIYYPIMKIAFEGTRRARKISKYTWYFLKSHFLFWNKFGYFSLNRANAN